MRLFHKLGVTNSSIVNTRKWIGPQEVQACYDSLSIPSGRTIYFQDKHKSLLDDVEQYFATAKAIMSFPGKVHQTTKPPIFFQVYGHSYTIVGIELLLDRTRNLIVLDPDVDESRLITRARDFRLRDEILSPYILLKKELRELGTYGFEILM